jgi:hypothetical protein
MIPTGAAPSELALLVRDESGSAGPEGTEHTLGRKL